KMAARLQATGSQLPVLLWTGVNAGHNVVAPGEEMNRLADEYAFLFHHLGVTYQMPPPPPLPRTPRQPTSAEYHGTKVIEDYRCLENADDQEGGKWADAQNSHPRGVLNRLPDHDAIRQRVQALLSASSADHTALQYRGGKLFALKSLPPREQPFLIT